MQMKHQQQRHSNVKYYTLKKSRPHKNGNGNGYNYNSRTRIHIIQTLPLPLSLLFSSELFLTTKVKMSRRNQTFYRCKFMKSRKPRFQNSLVLVFFPIYRYCDVHKYRNCKRFFKLSYRYLIPLSCFRNVFAIFSRLCILLHYY